MKPRKLFAWSIGATAVTAVCCFTPALVILLGGLGLSAGLAWLDFVLLPLLVAFSAVSLFALWVIARDWKPEHRNG